VARTQDSGVLHSYCKVTPFHVKENRSLVGHKTDFYTNPVLRKRSQASLFYEIFRWFPSDSHKLTPILMLFFTAVLPFKCFNCVWENFMPLSKDFHFDVNINLEK